MSEPNGNDKLHHAVEVRRSREAEWRATAQRPMWRNLSM